MGCQALCAAPIPSSLSHLRASGQSAREERAAAGLASAFPAQLCYGGVQPSPKRNPARFPISGDWSVSQFMPTVCKKMRHVSSKCTTRDRSSVSCQNAFHTKHAKSQQLNDEELKHRPTSAAKHPCRMPESLAPACHCYYYDYPHLDVQGARCMLDKVPGCPPLEREAQPGRYSRQRWRAMSSNGHTPPLHSK